MKNKIVFTLLLLVSLNAICQNKKPTLSDVLQLSNTNFAEAKALLKKIDTQQLSTNDRARFTWINNLVAREQNDLIDVKPFLNNTDVSFKEKTLLLSQSGDYFLTHQWNTEKAGPGIYSAYINYNSARQSFSNFEALYIQANYSALLFSQGNYSKASQIANKLLPQIESLPCSIWKGDFLNTLILCNVTANRPDIGIWASNEAIACYDNISFKDANTGRLFNNLGQLHISNSNYYDALEAQNKAREIFEKADRFPYEWYWHMGWLYSDMGNYILANSYIEQATNFIAEIEKPLAYDSYLIRLVSLKNLIRQKDFKKSDVLIEEINTLANTLKLSPEFQAEFDQLKATYFYEIEDFKQASELSQKALQNRKAFAGKEYIGILESYQIIIQSEYQLNNNETVFKYLNEVNQLIESTYKKQSLNPILEIKKIEIELYSQLDSDKSEQLLNEILEKSKNNLGWKTTAYFGLAKLYFSQYKTNPSEALLRRAKTQIDSGYVYMNQELFFVNNIDDQVNFRGDTKEKVALAIAIYHKIYQNHPTKDYANALFKWMDGSKQILLKQNALFSQIEQLKGISKDNFKQLKKIKSELSAYRTQFTSSNNDVLKKRFQSKIDALEIALNNSLLNISNDSKTFYDYFIQQKPIQIEQLQSLLTPNESFLLYQTQEDQAIVMLIHHDDFLVKTLPLLQIKNQFAVYKTSMKAFDFASYQNSAYGLYQNLIEPIQNQLKKKLYISTDSQLHQLNFETLIKSKKGHNFLELDYLLYDYEMTYIPSATNYFLMQQRDTETGDKKICFFSPTTFSANKVRQPFINDAFKTLSEQSKGVLFKGKTANKTNYLASLEAYDYLFLGTHTELNDQEPMYSTTYFSEDSEPVYTYQIYEKDKVPEMMVLASCSSQGGKETDYFSFISLASGFFYAGSQVIISTLWDVDEKSTSTIIQNSFLSTKNNVVSQKLQEAKIKFILDAASNPDLANPIYWGGIVNFGDNKRISLYPERNFKKIIFISLLVLLALFLFKKWLKF